MYIMVVAAAIASAETELLSLIVNLKLLSVVPAELSSVSIASNLCHINCPIGRSFRPAIITLCVDRSQ